jgi:hypothetical protein
LLGILFSSFSYVSLLFFLVLIHLLQRKVIESLCVCLCLHEIQRRQHKRQQQLMMMKKRPQEAQQQQQCGKAETKYAMKKR